MKYVLVAIVALVVGLAGGRYLLAPQTDMSVQSVAPPADGGETVPAAPADEPVQWKMASALASTLPVAGTGCVSLTEELAMVSDGDIQLRFFEPGALVPALEVFDAVSTGAVDAGCSTPGFWAGKVPALQIFSAVPFGPRAGEYLAWLDHGGGKELFQEIYAKHNIHGVHCNMIPPEGSGWFREPVDSIDQLNGLKMRFFGLGARVMERFGVSTQLIAPGDIFPALELGTIDAAELSMPLIDLELGFWQVAKHYYFPGWHQPSTLGELIVNLERWNALSERQKATIEMACSARLSRSFAEGEATQFAALQELQGHGVELHNWPQEMIEAYRAAWNEVVAEEAANDEDFGRVWESLSTFRENYKLWADLGYVD